MKRLTLSTQTEDQTIALGRKISTALHSGDILCLHGELGSGKTTLVKGIAKGLCVKEDDIHSPTFVLMNQYKGKRPLYHFDLYRLEDVNEINQIGYEEFLYGEGISVIEWAEKLKSLYPKEYLKINLKHQGKNKREIVCEASGPSYEQILDKLK